MAYLAVDGTPRVVPTKFHWTGDELGMPTFVSAPRAAPHRPPGRAASQPGRGHHDPYRGLPTPKCSGVPGKAAVSEVDGVALEYALVARRYMGGDAAAYLAEIDQPGTRMARSRCAPPGSDRRLQTRLPEAWAA